MRHDTHAHTHTSSFHNISRTKSYAHLKIITEPSIFPIRIWSLPLAVAASMSSTTSNSGLLAGESAGSSLLGLPLSRPCSSSPVSLNISDSTVVYQNQDNNITLKKVVRNEWSISGLHIFRRTLETRTGGTHYESVQPWIHLEAPENTPQVVVVKVRQILPHFSNDFEL